MCLLAPAPSASLPPDVGVAEAGQGTIGTGDQRLRARIAPRIARLEGLELSYLRDRQRTIEERLPELKRMVPFRGESKEEETDLAEYYDLVDELFAIKTVLAWNHAKQLSVEG